MTEGQVAFVMHVLAPYSHDVHLKQWYPELPPAIEQAIIALSEYQARLHLDGEAQRHPRIDKQAETD